MDLNTKRQILAEAEAKLISLQREEQRALIEQERRDRDIKNAKAVIEFLSADIGEGERSAAPSIENIIVPLEPTLTIIEGANQSTFIYPNGTWQDRIKAYLKFRNHVLTIENMASEFRKHHSLEEYSNDSLKAVISNTVSVMVKNQLLKSYKPAWKMRGLYYGNPLWFDGEQLKENHQPDLKTKLLW